MLIRSNISIILYIHFKCFLYQSWLRVDHPNNNSTIYKYNVSVRIRKFYFCYVIILSQLQFRCIFLEEKWNKIKLLFFIVYNLFLEPGDSHERHLGRNPLNGLLVLMMDKDVPETRWLKELQYVELHCPTCCL